MARGLGLRKSAICEEGRARAWRADHSMACKLCRRRPERGRCLAPAAAEGHSRRRQTIAWRGDHFVLLSLPISLPSRHLFPPTTFGLYIRV